MLRSRVVELLRHYRKRDESIARIFAHILSDIENGCVGEADAWEMVNQYALPVALRPVDVQMVESFRIAMSSAFHNKVEVGTSLPELRPVLSKSFRNMTVTPVQFAKTVTAGNAFTVGVYADGIRRKSNYISSQILALDFDDKVGVGDLMCHPFIQRFAHLLYPSPSSTEAHLKSRAVFILTEPVTDWKAWEQLQEAVLDHCHALKPDPQCKDCARFYYGSDVPGSYRLPKNFLPVSIVEALPEYRAIEQRKVDRQRVQEFTRNYSGDVSDKAINAYIDTVIRNLALAGNGGRNDALFKASCALFQKRKDESWNMSESALEAELLNACKANGLASDDGLHSIESTINSAMRRV